MQGDVERSMGFPVSPQASNRILNILWALLCALLGQNDSENPIEVLNVFKTTLYVQCFQFFYDGDDDDGGGGGGGGGDDDDDDDNCIIVP